VSGGADGLNRNIRYLARAVTGRLPETKRPIPSFRPATNRATVVPLFGLIPVPPGTDQWQLEAGMEIPRRTFLAGAPALAALPLVGDQESGRRERHASFDPWIEVRGDHLGHNVGEVSRWVAGRPILAVIKNNGYGLGVENVARILEPLASIRGFAVVKLHEALRLREAGIRKPVLLMGPCDEPEMREAAARDIEPMVYTPVGPVLDRIAAALQRPVPVHVCVDTGIGRVGVPWREAAAYLRELAARPSIEIRGTMMTFTEDPEFDPEQIRRFRSLCSGLEGEGVRLGLKHAASSFALFQQPDGFFDMVRPGMVLFGIYPEAAFRTLGVMELRPAVSLKCRVIYVKQLRRGESAGYNRAYAAERDVWVATLPVGHADGWPRAAAQGARVRIGDRLYPVIASVSASHSIVELGDTTQVRIGDIAVCFDWQEKSRPEDVSAACGASVYDLTMHLNALLPRVVIT
jgi:alanine racemase